MIRRAAALLAAAGAPAALAAALAAEPPAPAVEAVDAAGLRRVLESERGKVVVLNFWATWCDPCREEFPDLARLAREERARLTLVSVSLDDTDLLEAQVRPFLARMGAPGRALIRGPGDPDAFINGVDPDWSGALPATFVHDRAGVRVHAVHGATSYAALRKLVEPLLATSP